MRTRRFFQVDVFADRSGLGNPLAVVLDADDLDTAAMQRLARWTNLSETAFLTTPAAAADYHVRIFTPNQELPFAGHPSLGAAWAARESGWIPVDQRSAIQQCGAGLLPLRFGTDGAISVRAPRARRLHAHPHDLDRLHGVLGDVARGAVPAARWDNGPVWWVVELADEACVRELQLDMAALSAFTGHPSVALAVFARCIKGGPHDLAVRAFCPADGVPEDPVTGSANAAIAQALADANQLPGRGGAYRASQGREVGRDGTVRIEVDAEGHVWVGGLVQPVITGSIHWPAS